MNPLLSFLISLMTVSAVFCKPTAERSGQSSDDEVLQQIESLSQRFETENNVLKAELEHMRSEQLEMEEFLRELHQDGNYINNYSDTLEVQEIHDITFTFPRLDNANDWVKYLLPFPQLEDFTMCFWISPEDLKDAYIFNYARSSSDDRHLSVAIIDENTLGVFLYDTYYAFEGFGFKANEKVHLCISTSLSDDTLTVYENGAFKERKDISTWSYILESGALYFGLDQDTPNGGFRYPYKGEISNFIIWPRNLSAKEIRGITTACSYPKDYILRPQLTNIEWSGNAKVSIDNVCPADTFGSFIN